MKLSKAITELKLLLPQYLKDQDIVSSKSKKFACINPHHKDSTPSASLYPGSDYTEGRCFGCVTNFDIFTAAHWLEGMPQEGPEWVSTTVSTLCERYDIPLELEPLTDAQKASKAALAAFQEAARILTTHTVWSKDCEEYINKNKWKKEVLLHRGVGCLSREILTLEMSKKGYSAEYLRTLGLLGEHNCPFDGEQLVFTVYNHRGQALGFSYRTWDGKQKYVNPHMYGYGTESLKKGETLYGLDKARRCTDQPLILVEGYTDVLTLNHKGINNVAAICGTALTKEQILLLESVGFHSIVLALDWDAAGQIGIRRAIDLLMKESQDLDISIIGKTDKTEGLDPSDFVLQHGKKGWLALPNLSAFSWLLQDRLTGQTPKRKLAEDMVRIIALESSAITREEYTKELANTTGVSIHALDIEVGKQLNKRERQRNKIEKNIIERMALDLDKFPDHRISILSEAAGNIEKVRNDYESGKYSSRGVLSLLRTQKIKEESIDPSVGLGFKMNLMPQLAKCFEGGKDWASDTLMLLGGEANAGKSSLMSNIAFDIAHSNKDATVIYFSIDDSGRDILPKFLCNAHVSNLGRLPTSKFEELSIGAIINPGRWASMLPSKGHKERFFDFRQQAYNLIENLVKEDRFLIKDATDGATLEYMEAVIRFHRGKYPSRRIFCVLDNTHNLQDYGGKDMRERFSKIADTMNNICNKYSVCMLASVEYKKRSGGMRGGKLLPKNEDIAECMTGDSLVFTTQGLKRIDQIIPGNIVYTKDENNRIVTNKVLAKLDKGVQQVYKVMLKGGRTIKVTGNHPFFTEKYKWNKLSELSVGDFVALPSEIPQPKSCSNPINNDIARLLGYMAGDGCYALKSTPRFTNRDKGIIKDIKTIVQDRFKLGASERLHNGSLHLRFTNGRQGCKVKNPLTEYLKTLDIWGQTGMAKNIPTELYSQTNEVISHYISGLIATDGSIDTKKKTIRFFNKSNYLTQGLISLLSRLGIYSTLNNVKNGVNAVCISGDEAINLAQLLFIPGAKGNKCKQLASLSRLNKNKHDHLPILFTERLKEITTKARININDGRELGFQVRDGHRVTRSIGSKLASSLKDKGLQAILNEQLRWVNIVKIEKLDKEQVWDLTIDGTHNFIANNIIVHNTRAFNYRAKWIGHIYNDMHERQEDYDTFHIDPMTKKPMPRILLLHSKNKINGFKEITVHDFFPHLSTFKWKDESEAKLEAKKYLEDLKEEEEYDQDENW